MATQFSEREMEMALCKCTTASYSHEDDFCSNYPVSEVHLANIDMHLSKLVNIESQKLVIEQEKSKKLSGIATLIAIGILAKVLKKYYNS